MTTYEWLGLGFGLVCFVSGLALGRHWGYHTGVMDGYEEVAARFKGQR